jgi:drug/metabolite transporter (DMT)-like permease
MKYLYVFIIVLCWSINPFLKKIVTNHIQPIEYNIYSNTLSFIYLIMFSLYQNKYNMSGITINIANKLSKNHIGIMMIVSILTLVPSYLMIVLNQKYSVSGITAVVQSLNIIVTTIIGVVYMGDPINMTKIGGILMTSLGIYLLQ